MPRVLIADKLEASGLDLLARHGLEVDNRPGLKGDDLKAALQAADAVICRSQPKITADLLESPGKLRCIARAGVGVDTIDVPAATKRGIVVMNTPSGNTVSAAEHTVALMMALARNIPAADATMRAGGWDRNRFLGTQLAGKTLGVVGLGRIGQEVARRAAGLDMRVMGFDPFVSTARVAELGLVPAASLDALLPEVDFLTLHIPLTPETKHLINAERLSKLKRTARVLNVARGGVIDEQALADALRAGTVAGAAVDVFAVEPTPADQPLRTAPNCVLTPHLGASTAEAQENVALEAAQLVSDYLLKGQVANAVNMTAVDPAELAALRPFLDLARRLGLFHAQQANGAVKRATLTYKGDLAGRKTNLLTAAFTAGLLGYRLEGVNLVNAGVTARERGLEIAEASVPKKGDFAAAMAAEVETDGGSLVAAGTLFGDQYPRLVQVGPYRLESYLDGTLMLFHHTDAPGLIGFVGTIFGRHAVNIAAMTVGRAGNAPGGPAIGVLNLDSPPPPEALAEVTAHPQITRVSVLTLPPAGDLPGWLG
jgi:D-3-phosphoglycerate dehydrogenase / 2-oxoglutarate reductase